MIRTSFDNKGQILLIIGIVMALGLLLVNIVADFEDVGYSGEWTSEEASELGSLERSFMERYEEASGVDVTYGEVAQKLEDFIGFVKDRSEARDIGYLFSIAVQEDETNFTAGVHNFLGRELEEVEINGEECSEGGLKHGENCMAGIELTEEDYTVEVSYSDQGRNQTKSYRGLKSEVGNSSAVFYRTEFSKGDTEIVVEDEAWSRPVS